MKRYIFITFDIHMMGGAQNYLAGKTDFLEKKGWEVRVLYPGNNKKSCMFQMLNRFVDGGCVQLKWLPTQLPKYLRDITLEELQKKAGEKDDNYELTIVESHDDKSALWGELLAEKIKAKHYCFSCNELFRGDNKYYLEYIDFFNFKHNRKELLGITQESLVKLFDGYKNVPEKERYWFMAAPINPVQDVEYAEPKKWCKSDWNICYMGRCQKEYVPKVFYGVNRFAEKHPDKKINFVIVGDDTARKSLLKEIFEEARNVTIISLGDLVPIPKSLFDYLDVVIAGSGCAKCAIERGVPTIIPDPHNSLSNGVFGYQTRSILYHEEGFEQYEYDVSLEKVLIERIQDKLQFSCEQTHNENYYYQQQMEFLSDSDSEVEYYNKRIEENQGFKTWSKFKVTVSFLKLKCINWLKRC